MDKIFGYIIGTAEKIKVEMRYKMEKRTTQKVVIFLITIVMILGSFQYISSRASETEAGTGPEVSVETYCLMDADSGQVILQKGMDTQMRPASITKILTALIVVENVANLNEEIEFSQNAVTTIPILSSTLAPVTKSGERMTVKDALYGMVMKSANECANGLAEHVAGSMEAFADLMNERLKEIGTKNTHFVTPSGLDDDNHYTTAYDMALIFRAALSNPTVKELFSAKSYTIPATNVSGKRTLQAGHQFVTGAQQCDGVYAGKTGYTVKAKWTLATAATRNGRNLILISLKSDEGRNYEDAKLLLDYGFGLLENTNPVAGPTVYHPVVTEMDGSGFTIKWNVGNDAVRAEFPVWTDRDGNTDMTKVSTDISPGEISYRVNIADHNKEYGVYTVQAYVYGSNDEPTISSIKVLMTGSKSNPGVLQYNGQSYYIKDNGALATGWIETEEGCYYASPEKAYLSYGLQQIGNVGYYMDQNGKLQTGWKELNGKTYYFQASGDMAYGVIQIDGVIYYFGQDGALQQGLLNENELKEIQYEMEKIHTGNYYRSR